MMLQSMIVDSSVLVLCYSPLQPLHSLQWKCNCLQVLPRFNCQLSTPGEVWLKAFLKWSSPITFSRPVSIHAVYSVILPCTRLCGTHLFPISTSHHSCSIQPFHHQLLGSWGSCSNPFHRWGSVPPR